jgi:hypothetical protein
MTDPVQLLIDAGAIPSSPFGPQSRYSNVALAVLPRRPGEPGIAYVRRRFIPSPASIGSAGVHRVAGHDRPDLLGATFLGDVLLYWRIADFNAVVDPNELTDTPGRRIGIPQPPGM